jgi:tetratricopeptide (TPR) repeat protein
MKAFWKRLDKQGYGQIAGIANEMKAKDSAFNLPEDDVNDLGFILLEDDKKKEALEIFKYNLNEHPKSDNVYDSVGQAYAALGKNDLAIQNFKKSIELNPKNTWSAERIKKLEEGNGGK